MDDFITTNIPGRPSIELPAFYDRFKWYYPDCELETKEWFVKNACEDWVYIDCGANIGYYSILFSQLSPKGEIHAIEPTTTVDLLHRNLIHNKCNNVTVHNLAVGKSDGRMVENIYKIWGEEPEEIECEFIKIDTFVDRLNLKKVDCLKIDVDSFDFEVLIGAEEILRGLDPWLVVELNHALSKRGYSNMAALSWLVELGYKHALVLDYDNFIFKRSAPSTNFTQNKNIQLNFL